jgi:hypothetical protein
MVPHIASRRRQDDNQTALNISSDQLTALLEQVEGYLAPEFVKRCRKPVVKHSRGVIVDRSRWPVLSRLS